ncbi:dihydroorotate dehydrogenase electron transfer subunit [Desulfopila sp. IMCC35008]|uniref:dihydroorotate dehydrogenase electron transfer subunit n=1 Tax=Desulfopila sp. IMCC35008 TaxID=2653858 RepID=UPI001F10872A|nr:dihydroorotate dehydrogenase electron transfer subunit [Desulfopila sp. IMCC35008]
MNPEKNTTHLITNQPVTMPQYQEKTIVTRVERLSEENMRLTLKAPEIAAEAQAGQFVMIRTALGMDPLLRRPFSIHQTDSSGHIQIYFKIVGKGTDLLAHVREGEELSVLGPLGKGFRIPEKAPVCLVGGGLGIAPMLFLCKEVCRVKKGCGNDTLVLGGRTKTEVEPLIEDFQQMGLKIIATTDDGTYGEHGNVTDVLNSIQLPADTVVFACGPEPMMAAVSGYCKKHGLRCQVSVESVMACGMGACLGCNRTAADGGYVHVCLDGPVFDAEEMVWSL